MKYFWLISITWAFFNLELVIWENMKDIKIMSSSLFFLGVCLAHLINSKNSNKISFLGHIQMKFSIGHIGWLRSFFMKRNRLCMKMKRCILSGSAMWKILKLIPLGMYFFVIYCITSVVSLRAVSPQLLVTVSVWVKLSVCSYPRSS